MPSFGARSRRNLDTCHPVLTKLMERVVLRFDISIIEGFRNLDRQAELYASGMTQVKSGGAHNRMPSMACDILFYPFLRGDWERRDKFNYMAGFVFSTFWEMRSDGRLDDGYELVWGGSWDGLLQTDESFLDMPHFEIRRLKVER